MRGKGQASVKRIVLPYYHSLLVLLTNRQLSSVGVTGVKSQAGYYYMPDFEVVRAGLKKRGITTNEQMVQAMLEEAGVAVRETIIVIIG